MEDLQNLLEKINRDGIEKAEAEAKKIVDEARSKAEAIVKEAFDKAAQAKADADKAAQAYAERAAETIRQSARDVKIGVQGAVTALLEKLLVKDVDKALGDEKNALQVVTEAIRDLTGPGEIRCGEKLAKALGAQLAALKGFTLATDETLGAGFAVRTDGGRVEHDFTGAAISAELAKRLRPDLAKLLG